MRSVAVVADDRTDLQIIDIDAPVPSPDEAVVEVCASSINRGELSLVAMRPSGWQPGQDVSGVVIREAADGAGPARGTRVVGLAEQGAWSEQVVVSTRKLTEVPDGFDLVAAATLPLAGLTALRTIRLLGPAIGKRLLVTGASGGVGRLQVQLGVLAGMQVTAVTTRSASMEGAHHTVAHVTEASGPFDAVMESIGGPSLSEAISVAAPGADIVVLGASSGEKSSINIYDFIGHEGVRLHSYLSYANDGDDAADLAYLVELAAHGKLDPGIGETLHFDEVSRGVEILSARSVPGKIVLTWQTRRQTQT